MAVLKNAPLDNFHRVDDLLFTSALPKNLKQIEFLKRNRFGGIVSISPMDEQLAEHAAEMGLEVSLFPSLAGLYSMQVFNQYPATQPIPNKVFENFFRLVAENELRGTRLLVHCKAGVYGSGTLASIYKVAKGMPLDKDDFPTYPAPELLKVLYTKALVSTAKQFGVLPAKPPRTNLRLGKRGGKNVFVAKSVLGVRR